LLKRLRKKAKKFEKAAIKDAEKATARKRRGRKLKITAPEVDTQERMAKKARVSERETVEAQPTLVIFMHEGHIGEGDAPHPTGCVQERNAGKA
jgi:hypothetical protein